VAGSERVVIVGGGVGGLTAALALGRAGHDVTVLERDPLPATADAEQAFAAERRGAPQAHQTHGFLARMQVLLRERFPDVLEALLAAGATTTPTTANLGEPEPGDDDLRVIIIRRTTLEWVLRTAALAEPGVEIRTAAPVAGVAGAQGTVTGVVLDDGTAVDADVVVAATGRRGDVPGWLGRLGVDVPETIHESGLMYVTRWYRLPAGFDVLSLDPKLGGDLGFVKYLGVPGDGDTLSITLAIRPDDRDLRSALADPAGFERACRLLPGPDQFFSGPELEPVGDVRPMGGLLNRLRRFVDADGLPTVLGFHAIGDAHTCTNPLYGRGCSLAMVQAVLLADAVRAFPGDPAGRASAYEAACAREVEPWFHASVEMDTMGADPAGGIADPESPMARVFAAAQTDPVLGRGFARLWNLIATPGELAADPQYLERVAHVMANPDRYPIPPREGPSRHELLDALSKEAADA
jgi:2-polyprenyl-6-methoxyphenol hydroxylase-like FAD-dependent oxidoreductase